MVVNVPKMSSVHGLSALNVKQRVSNPYDHGCSSLIHVHVY